MRTVEQKITTEIRNWKSITMPFSSGQPRRSISDNLIDRLSAPRRQSAAEAWSCMRMITRGLSIHRPQCKSYDWSSKRHSCRT